MKNILFCIILSISIANVSKAQIKEITPWDEVKITDPFIEKLISSKAMQRLKLVDQSGPVRYYGLSPEFSRYSHSIGVFALLQKAGVGIDEQAAGLLHDASHTAFSHVADLLFGVKSNLHSYQDEVHLWYLEQTDISNIAKEFNVAITKLNPDLPQYKALENQLPDICADRIEYNIHTGVLYKIITKEEAKEIVDNLQFKNSSWYFTDINQAKKFARLSLYFTENTWEVSWNKALYKYFTTALQRAIQLKLITKDQVQFSTDQEILKQLNTSTDPIIQKSLKACADINNSFIVKPISKGDIDIKPKFRGVDPLICEQEGKCKRLTAVDQEYKKEFLKIKQWCKKGYALKLTHL